MCGSVGDAIGGMPSASVFQVCSGHRHGLLAQGDGLRVPFGARDPPEMDFLLEDEPPGDDDLFLNDGQDGHVAFLSDGRRRFDDPANRDAFDDDVLARQVFLNQDVSRTGVARRPDQGFANPFRDGDGLGMKQHHLGL